MILERSIDDYVQKIESFGSWAIGQDSRKKQMPYLIALRELISELPSDPVIRYYLKKFLDEVPQSTPRSVGSDMSRTYSRRYLSCLIREVSDEPWENSNGENRQKKANDLFISE